MTAHVHTWDPVEGAVGKYTCACSAYGQRPRRGGAIVELTAARRPWWAGRAAPTVGAQDSGQAIGGRAPNLDETERRR